MSQKPRQKILTYKRRRYLRAGRDYKPRPLDEPVELFGLLLTCEGAVL